MSQDFIILHLSDTHIGNPQHEPDSSAVLRPLLDDLNKCRSDFGKPNLIVFSGDLAYGELDHISLADQYEQASAWLNEVYSALSSTPEQSPFFMVPGNHDINQFIVSELEIDFIRNLKSEQAWENVESLMKENKLDWPRFLARQEAWKEFHNSYSQRWHLDEELNLVSGSIEFSNKEIGIVGLNSSWASTPSTKLDGANGKLWIGRYQLQKAVALVENADFKIAVAHHPLSWLNPSERNWITQKIESHFEVFLHGHDHSQWFHSTAQHLAIAAGACYQGSASGRENAYSWTTLNFDDQTAKVNLRQYTDKGRGGWIAYEIPGLTNHNGEATLLFPQKVPNTRAAIPTGTDVKSQLIATVESPVAAQAPSETVREFINELTGRFGFRWEPSSFRYSHDRPLVYWPIRLRHPTPIHAVQCFAAAGLQRCGCEIVLCIDELGHKDYSVEEFRKTIQRWFRNGTGDDAKLTIHECSNLLEQDGAADIWRQVKQWLGVTNYSLERVLRVSKLLPIDGNISLEEFGSQRPRRLLTPAVVWTCLLYLHRGNESRPIITLAGYDELPLWQAWRDCSDEPNIKVGHLYAPELNQSDSTHGVRPVHMAAASDLAWVSREDISRVLLNEVSNIAGSTDWLDPHRLIPWCIGQCVLLPSWLNDSVGEFVVNGTTVTDTKELDRVQPDTLLPVLIGALDKWLLQDLAAA